MSIGGIDEILIAPARESAGDIILRACQRLWPGEVCYFQEGDDENHVYPFTDPWVWIRGTASEEFFVYPNQEAFRAWADGPTPQNVNLMLHFILGEVAPPTGETREVAVVYDRTTKEIKAFLRDLQDGFLSALAVEGVRKVA
jgi:hypothetical protein